MIERTIFIKHMVCPRCLAAVREIFTSIGAEIIELALGEVKIKIQQESWDEDSLKKQLHDRGFELLEDPQRQLVEKIKTTLIQLIRKPEEQLKTKLSVYLSKKLQVSYYTLWQAFSEVEGKTIERYYILQKIERAKELLSYGELSLAEIAFLLGYKNVQHISRQFKSETGMSASAFKKLQRKDRKFLDEI